MRSVAALGAFLLLFAFNASPDDDPEAKKLLVEIAGKEKLPASQVFKNVKLLGDIPAGRFLRIMDMGYSQSLGVMCDHCHVEGRWDADEKRPKLAAREMIAFTKSINEKLVQMENIETAEATVNCTTCHRGFVKPALQMK
ncbi:MAG: c-type cytochrome [Acidobacteriota bacterium]|nr:c-type cytochrome [Acidobacteriota bacterium]